MELWIALSLISSTVLLWLFVKMCILSVKNEASRLLNHTSLASSIADFIENNLPAIKSKVLQPENYQKLVPQVEAHVDHFLRVRLKEEMPVVGMMIGDRTIAQMKEIFLKELESLFPEVMEGYLNNLTQNLDVRQLIASRLQGDGAAKLTVQFQPILRKTTTRLQILGATAGFVIGLIQLGIYFLCRG